MYRREVFLVFSFFTAMLYYYLTNVTSTDFEKNIYIKDEELGTECSQLAGMFWQLTFGNESEVINHCCSGNQASLSFS